MPRFAILEHIAAPDDAAGRHYDLLLEDGESCLTWRLEGLPRAGGPSVAAVELPPHRLAWLDHESGEVSGGRGFARRITAGTFEMSAGDPAPCDPADGMSAKRCVILLDMGGGPMRLELERRGTTWMVAAEAVRRLF